ncbi:MAG: CDP-2,3-bis-(O-geranylgeranyl)-sn-glycerol synthase [Thermoplasmata archaeon]
MTPIEIVLAGIWLMIPALVPNSAAVLFGGGTPMDFGRSWHGKRILGDGKTWRGFFGGALSGAAVGLVQLGVVEALDASDAWSFGEWPWSLCAILSLAFGSMLGDSTGSFLKRRMDMGRGHRAPVLDQYNFVAGAVLLALVFRTDWFLDHLVRDDRILTFIVFLIVVPMLHRGVNIIGYKLGKKNVPW